MLRPYMAWIEGSQTHWVSELSVVCEDGEVWNLGRRGPAFHRGCLRGTPSYSPPHRRGEKAWREGGCASGDGGGGGRKWQSCSWGWRYLCIDRAQDSLVKSGAIYQVPYQRYSTHRWCIHLVSGSIEPAVTSFSKISFKPAQWKIQDKISPQRNSEPGEAKTRRRREVASDEDYYSFPIRETLQEDTSPYSGQVSDLSSALLSSALDGHKVRRTKENTSKMFCCSDSSSGRKDSAAQRRRLPRKVNNGQVSS